MSKNQRRAARIPVEFPVTVYLFDNKGQNRMGDSLAGHIKNFSPIGAALAVATIQLDGEHLFYSCHDNPDIVIELVFALDGDAGRVISVPAAPVWFDRDLESEKKQFVLGLRFLTDPKSPEIKNLSKSICRDEKLLVTLWKKLF